MQRLNMFQFYCHLHCHNVIIDIVTVNLFYRMFYCNFPCSIEVGEVFVLKDRVSDDWGWATSQLSGESGLIPLNIMEECV